ncbi:MAG: hypothetical protein AAGA85_22435 [Bacteroidota bacterium]
MDWIIVGAAMLALSHMVWTDFKFRHIHAITLLLFTAATIAELWLHHQLTSQLWLQYLLNVSYTVLALSSGALILHLIRKISFREMIGKGDLLLLLPACFWFEIVHYLVWFNVSLVLMAISHLILSNLRRMSRKEGVPMAGYLSLTMIIYLFLRPSFS